MDFDFLDDNLILTDFEKKYIEIDVNGLAQRSQSKERKFFELNKEYEQLKFLMNEPPKSSEIFKLYQLQVDLVLFHLLNILQKKKLFKICS